MRCYHCLWEGMPFGGTPATTAPEFAPKQIVACWPNKLTFSFLSKLPMSTPPKVKKTLSAPRAQGTASAIIWLFAELPKKQKRRTHTCRGQRRGASSPTLGVKGASKIRQGLGCVLKDNGLSQVVGRAGLGRIFQLLGGACTFTLETAWTVTPGRCEVPH